MRVEIGSGGLIKGDSKVAGGRADGIRIRTDVS
jgi:hypothetical protein